MFGAIRLDASFLSDLSAFPQQIEEACEEGLDVVADEGEAHKLELIEETYARPIPRGKNGAEKWTRSGDWRAEQDVESGDNERRIVTRGNSDAYEPSLAFLKTERRNAAAEKTHQWLKENGQEIFERKVREKLG